MINNLIEQVANCWLNQTNLPSSSEVVAALLEAEKIKKKQKISYSFEQLIGTWQLSFVMGTKKAQSRIGIALGGGRYLPRFLKILLTYRFVESSPTSIEVENNVNIGSLQISLTGPVKFLSRQNIVAFNFIEIHIKFLEFTIYNGSVRGGLKTAINFENEPTSQDIRKFSTF